MSAMNATATPTREVYTHPLTPQQKGNLLTALDRCDACSGQAYYIATKDSMNLLFCRHHFNKQEDGLTTQGFGIVDQFFMLMSNVNPLENTEVY